MDVAGHIIKQLEKNFHVFQEKLDSLLPVFDEDVLHDARVAVKRIEALLWFSDLLYPPLQFHSVYMPTFLPIFKHMGVLRECQIHRLLVDEFSLPVTGSYKTNIAEEENLASSWLDANIPSFRREVFESVLREYKALKDVCSYNAASSVYKSFSVESIQKTSVLLFNPDLGSLHKARKLVKKMVYVEQLWLKIGKEHMLAFSECKDVAEYLGRWHDLIVFLDDVAGFVSDEYLSLIKRESIKNIKLAQKEWLDWLSVSPWSRLGVVGC